jgi:hypothetical protein
MLLVALTGGRSFTFLQPLGMPPMDAVTETRDVLGWGVVMDRLPVTAVCQAKGWHTTNNQQQSQSCSGFGSGSGPDPNPLAPSPRFPYNSGLDFGSTHNIGDFGFPQL